MSLVAKCIVPAIAVGSLLSSTAHAADDQKMKGIGLPVIFILFFIVAGLVSRNQLMAAFRNTNPDSVWVFRASLLCATFSIFFYLSHAWAYGIVSTVIAYGIAIATNSNLIQTHGKYIATVLFMWFLILIGIPSSVSVGIINAVNLSACNSFYGDFSDSMCKDGWLTFLLILSTVQISITFLSMLAVMAGAMGASVSDSVSAARHNHTNKNSDATDAGYQKFVEGSADSNNNYN